ncbi:MAG: TadE/TadG family type IV pilus assembly protein [Candidatus Aquicultorales bacterium]
MLLNKPTRRRLHDAKGASSVEFAILMPVLILILFGIVEFGLAYRDYLSITHAAREGARLAAVGDFSETEIAKRAYPVSPSSISLAYRSPDGAPRHGYPVEVTVRYDRPLNIPMFGKTTVRMSSTAEMRVEY